MPVSYEIRPDLACVFIRIEGIITDAELMEGQQRLFADASFQGHYARLIDTSPCERLAIHGTTVRSVAQAAEDHGMRKAAVVVTGSIALYGLVRMYEIYASQSDCRICPDEHQALAWLFEAV